MEIKFCNKCNNRIFALFKFKCMNCKFPFCKNCKTKRVKKEIMIYCSRKCFFDFIAKKKPQKNNQKLCMMCPEVLTGLKTLFCSIKCSEKSRRSKFVAKEHKI